MKLSLNEKASYAKIYSFALYNTTEVPVYTIVVHLIIVGIYLLWRHKEQKAVKWSIQWFPQYRAKCMWAERGLLQRKTYLKLFWMRKLHMHRYMCEDTIRMKLLVLKCPERVCLWSKLIHSTCWGILSH